MFSSFNEIENLDSNIFSERQESFEKLSKDSFSFPALYYMTYYSKCSLQTKTSCKRLMSPTYNRVRETLLKAYVIYFLFYLLDTPYSTLDVADFRNMHIYNVYEINNMLVDWGLITRDEIQDLYSNLDNDTDDIMFASMRQSIIKLSDTISFYKGIFYERSFGR